MNIPYKQSSYYLLFPFGQSCNNSVFTWKVYSNTLAQWNASKLAATNAISFTLFLFIYLLCLDDIHMIGYLDSYSYSGYLPKYKNKSTKWVSVCECPQKSVVSTVFFVFSNIRKGRPRSILHRSLVFGNNLVTLKKWNKC